MMEQDAAPARWETNAPPATRAAPGLRPRALRPAARSSLMADGSAGCGETCGTLRASLRSAARRRKNTAVERREAPAHGDVRGPTATDAPFGAPLPSGLSRGKDPQKRGERQAHPAPSQRTRAISHAR